MTSFRTLKKKLWLDENIWENISVWVCPHLTVLQPCSVVIQSSAALQWECYSCVEEIVMEQVWQNSSCNVQWQDKRSRRCCWWGPHWSVIRTLLLVAFCVCVCVCKLWDSETQHLMSEKGIPMLWSFHLEKLHLLAIGSSSLGPAMPYIEASLCVHLSWLSHGRRMQHQLSPLWCPVQRELQDCWGYEKWTNESPKEHFSSLSQTSKELARLSKASP